VDITFPGQTCCNQELGPNLSGVRPGSFTLVNTPSLVGRIVINGFGGARIVALLLSQFVRNIDIIDEPLTRGKGASPAWSDAEIDDVVAFLKTLTDRDVKTPRISPSRRTKTSRD
jgi:hypothetical protein